MINFSSNKIFATVSTCIALAFSAAAQEKPEVRIGAILPMTGTIASVGEAMQRGLTMAASDTKHIKANIIIEDDQTANRVRAVSAANKLVGVDKVDIVFNAYASTTSAISSVLKTSNVPCLVLWDSNRALPKLGEQIFGFGYENELAGEDMASFAHEHLHHKTVAIIGFHDEWSELISRAFEERFKALGGAVVLHEQVNGDTTDFRTIMARLKSSNAGAVYLPLYGLGLQSAIRQARNVKFEGDLLTADSFVDADIDATKGAAEGMYLTQIWLDDVAFMRKYEAAFGNAKTSGTNLGYTALAYDAVMLVDAAAGQLVLSGEKLTAISLLARLPSFSFDGVLGTTRISPHRSVERREKILQVKGGSYTEPVR